MNAKQRDYLTVKIGEQFGKEKKAIESQMPKEPQLNSYLMAAFMTDTIEFKSIEHLKRKIVANIMQGNTQVVNKSGWRDEKGGIEAEVTVMAVDLFEIPEAYNEAYAAYQIKINDLNQQIEAITRYKEAVLMKINLGTADSLSNMITEASDMVSLSLLNESLKPKTGLALLQQEQRLGLY